MDWEERECQIETERRGVGVGGHEWWENKLANERKILELYFWQIVNINIKSIENANVLTESRLDLCLNPSRIVPRALPSIVIAWLRLGLEQKPRAWQIKSGIRQL